MLASLLLAALSPAAPVPRDTAPTGPAPYILNLRPGPDGVKLTVRRTEKQKVMMIRAVAGGPNGAQQVQQVEQEVPVTKYVQLGLSDLKDLKVYSADGKEVPAKEAVKKVSEGGVFVASANGKKVDSTYLKLFKDDVLVFVSPDLVPQGNRYDPVYGGEFTEPGFPGGGPIGLPVPLPAPALPPQVGPGGAVQIQILPAVEVAPAVPVAPPAPPKKK